KYEAYIEQAIYDECLENIDLTKKAIEEIKNEVLASVQSEVDTVLKNVEAGKSFDELIETYSDDPGSKEEPIKTNGYLVHKDSKAWDEAFKDAAFSLEAVGDISSATVGTLGVYIVKYESDPVFGAAALENVRSEVENTIYNERRSELFGTLTAQWIQEADIQLALDAWK
ncbi:MAG: peptidylprolyl isomerase, partial [Clostridia bacterium]|nr:peptidylprolyl isomerase [Clostridia bacterium]